MSEAEIIFFKMSDRTLQFSPEDILFYEIRNSNHAIQLQISMFFAHAILFSNFCKMFPSFNKLYVIFLNLRIHQSKQVTFLTLKR